MADSDERIVPPSGRNRETPQKVSLTLGTRSTPSPGASQEKTTDKTLASAQMLSGKLERAELEGVEVIPLPPGVGRIVAPRKEEQLSALPLSVLLPACGDLSHLVRCQEAIVSRYQALALLHAESQDEITKEKLAEESMLSQVIQWLSAGSSRPV